MPDNRIFPCLLGRCKAVQYNNTEPSSMVLQGHYFENNCIISWLSSVAASWELWLSESLAETLVILGFSTLRVAGSQ